MNIKGRLLFIIILVLSVACEDEQRTILPDVFVNVRLNLTSQEALPLRQDGGFIEYPGGIKGLIIYRQDQNTYRAFERNCTYQPNEPASIVIVDPSRLFMIDTTCGSQFNWEGNAISGSAPVGLKRYQTLLNGDILSIYN